MLQKQFLFTTSESNRCTKLASDFEETQKDDDGDERFMTDTRYKLSYKTELL